MTGLNPDHSAEVSYIGFTAICAAVFFVFMMLLEGLSVALVDYQSLGAQGDTLEAWINVVDVITLMFAAFSVLTFCATGFPSLSTLGDRSIFRAISWDVDVDGHFSKAQQVLWDIGSSQILCVLSMAYYNLTQALINCALLFGGQGLYAAASALLLENTQSWSTFIALFLVYTLLVASMSLVTLFWLLRIDIRRQAPGGEAAV